MKIRDLAAVSAALVVSYGVAGAESPRQDDIDWPVQSLFLDDVAQVQNEGEVQTQVGVNLRRSGGDDHWEAPLEAQAGVAPRVQLEAQVPWMSEQQSGVTSRGVGNVELGADYRLLASSERASALSLGLEVQLPTGSWDVEDNVLVIRPRLRGYKQVGAIGLDAAIAPGLARDLADGGYEPEGELTAGMTVGSGVLVPAFEARGEFGDEPAAEGLVGFHIKPGEKVDIGLALLGGVRDGDPVWGGASNLVIELGGQ